MKFSSVENWLPEKRDKKWFLFMPPIIAIMMAVFFGTSKLLLHISIAKTDVIIWLFLSFIASAILCGFGYAGLKSAFLFSIVGILAGIVYMSYVFTRPIEARGIVGLVSGVQLAFIFIIIGINVQMLQYLKRKRREKE